MPKADDLVFRKRIYLGACETQLVEDCGAAVTQHQRPARDGRGRVGELVGQADLIEPADDRMVEPRGEAHGLDLGIVVEALAEPGIAGLAGHARGIERGEPFRSRASGEGRFEQ